MDRSKTEGALWGAFCADAYALGAHWVYDCDAIEAAPLEWKSHNKPLTTYHGGKDAGEFTHYGDQMLWLLESVAEHRGFDIDMFTRLWHTRMQSYVGYVDGASKATLAMLNEGTGHAGSKDLSAAGRFAPLLYFYTDDFKPLLKAVAMQSAFTHSNAHVERSSLYFAEVAYHLLREDDLEAVLVACAKEYDEIIFDWVMAGIKSKKEPTRSAIAAFGKSCGVGSGFPGVIHLLLKYQDDYENAMVENVKAGGDSAARGLIAGSLLGLRNGKDAIPETWIDRLKHVEEITDFMGMIDVCSAR
jgi:ADP-ribosylglycohydrolase